MVNKLIKLGLTKEHAEILAHFGEVTFIEGAGTDMETVWTYNLNHITNIVSAVASTGQKFEMYIGKNNKDSVLQIRIGSLLKLRIEDKIKEEGFSSLSEYVRYLLMKEVEM